MQEIHSKVLEASAVNLDELSFYNPETLNLFPSHVVEVTVGDSAPIAFLVRQVSSADVMLELPVDVAVELHQRHKQRGKDEPVTEEDLERSRLMMQFHRQAVLMGLVRPALDEYQIAQLPTVVVSKLSDIITMVDADADDTGADADADADADAVETA